MQETTKQNLEEEKLPKMICDLVWSLTDGGCKIKPEQMLSFQDEPVREFEDIIALIRLVLARQAQEIEEAVEKIKSVRWSTVYDVKFCDGYRQAIADTLLAIKQITNK